MPLQNAITKTLEKYGKAEQFLVAFNDSIQIKVAQNVERAFLGEAPTLNIVSKTYNQDVLITWIMARLENINDFCGVDKKMSCQQMEEVANIIAVEYYYLRITELHLFFHRLKSARYGQFYGVIDTVKVMEALSKFSSERITELNAFERKKNDEQMKMQREEWMRTGISRQEYERTKKIHDR